MPPSRPIASTTSTATPTNAASAALGAIRVLEPIRRFRNTPTLGLRLVCSLTQQLGGTIELDRSHGTSFRIRLPRELARSR